MRSFNHIFLSFLLTLSLIGAAGAQTPKKEAQKSNKNVQSAAKKDAKKPQSDNKATKKAETTAKNAKPKPESNAKTSKPKTAAAETEIEPTEDEKAALAAAQSSANPFERISNLKEFLKNFPRSPLKLQAQELLVTARAEYADELMRTGDPTGGKEQFKLVLKEVPETISDKLFADVLSRIPMNLFFRGEQALAFELAKKIEAKAANDPEHLLAIAQFYLMIENSEEARRLANRAVELKPESAAAQITIGLASRIGFRLEAATQAFGRALEIDPNSIAAKRGLADSLRGIGQSEDAARLYREILQENEADEAARSGLVMALFDAGNRPEAETEMAAALEKNPKNYQLLATAAYWYAANKETAKAVELGQKAVELEPRYTWSHIALARGLISAGRPLEAERTLLVARQYGNFPTLDYELANARYAAGFYEEAAADLSRHFRLKNGNLETSLAGRIKQDAPNFIELLSLERRAAILQPNAAETEENAERLKKLLAFSEAFSAGKKDAAAVTAAIQEFAAGDDAASIHRKLYAANKLLKEDLALPEVLTLTEQATEGVDAGVTIPGASAAVMAEELYEPRQLAAIQGNAVIVPEIQQNVLTNILRGRIEEIAGWSLYKQNRTDEAVIRLKRAVGILPDKSAWWRSSQWRLGAALEKADKPREALEAYVKSYRSAQPDPNRRAVIESLYVRLNGTNQGLDVKLGEAVAQNPSEIVSPPAQTVAMVKNPLPEIIAEINPPKPVVIPTPEPKSSEPANPGTEAQPTPQPEAKKTEPEKPAVNPTETEPEPTPELVKLEVPQPTPSPEIENRQPQTETPKSEPTPEAEKTETKPEIESTPAAPLPTPEVTPEPQPVETKTDETKSNEIEIKPGETEEKPEQPRIKSGKIDKTPDETESPPAEQEVKKEQEKPAKQTVSQAPRVLVIDNLKKTVTEVGVKKTENSETAQTQPEEIKKPAAEEKQPEEKPAAEKPAESNPNVKVVSTLGTTSRIPTRPRVVCVVWLNQDVVSVLSNGGLASLLVGIEGEGLVGDLVATSDSPENIEVKVNRDVQISGNRALYEIRSISDAKGDFTITFESNCGKKTVKVRVR